MFDKKEGLWALGCGDIAQSQVGVCVELARILQNKNLGQLGSLEHRDKTLVFYVVIIGFNRGVSLKRLAPNHLHRLQFCRSLEAEFVFPSVRLLLRVRNLDHRLWDRVEFGTTYFPKYSVACMNVETQVSSSVLCFMLQLSLSISPHLNLVLFSCHQGIPTRA